MARHFDGRRFFNPDAPAARGFLDVLRWKLKTRPEPSAKWFDDVTPCMPPARVEGSAIRVTMVNHSTLLLQLCGMNLLTDPVWSDRASPVAFAGPRRRRAPGIRWEDLPPIHAVMLSHNHYDHLDLPTLRRLSGGPEFVVPSKVVVGGMKPVHELDWWESVRIGPFTIHAVPAIHFSARTPFDRNRTLWCGYVLQSPAGTVYFAGDTAFGPHFAEIRERFGPFRMAFLPVGAYLPRWFMSPIHMDPQQAVQAAGIIEAEATIGIHHGTFQLADDAVDTPARELEHSVIQVLRNGEFREMV